MRSLRRTELDTTTVNTAIRDLQAQLRGDIPVAGNVQVTFTNTGLHILDTDATHDLIVKPGSNLTADRTLTVTTGDADRTLDLEASLTIPADPNADRMLFWDDSGGATAWLTAGAGLLLSGTSITGNIQFGLQVVTSTGASTYTPTTGTTHVLVIATGGGGGGGGADTDGSGSGGGGGGEAGGTSIVLWDAAELGANAAVSIGTGGNGGSATNGTNGSDGNNTTVNPAGTAATITGSGGNGGDGSGAATGDGSAGVGGAALGTASGGDLNISGGEGGYAISYGDNTALPFANGGHGGSSFWGGGGMGARVFSATSLAGNNGTAYGSGGGGAAAVDTTAGAAGGNGKAGVAIFLELIAA